MIGFFLVMGMVCGILRLQVHVNFDILDYLPKKSPSTIAIQVIENEYEDVLPNARVMVNDVTIMEAFACKEKISTIDGVLNIQWLDDVASITEPIEYQDIDVVETYYKDKKALFEVTIDPEKRVEAIQDIESIIEKKSAISGASVNVAMATKSTLDEIPTIVLISIFFVFLVMLFSTKSWIEPFLLMSTIGIAMVLNAGTNLLLGTISFITHGAGTLLLLAVTLDYSVFLLHRFHEYKEEGYDTENAVIEAAKSSWSVIAASAITDMVGFLVLVFMSFTIGTDLGLSLAKGILISLFTVFSLLPAVIVIFQQWIQKTKHIDIFTKLPCIGLIVCRWMIPFLILFAIVLVPAFLAYQKNQFYYGAEHIFGEQTKVYQDRTKIEEAFGHHNTVMLLVPRGNIASEKSLMNEIKSIPTYKSSISYVENVGAEIPPEFIETSLLQKLNSDRYTRIILQFDIDYEGVVPFQTVNQIRSIAQRYYPNEYHLAGDTVSIFDLKKTIVRDHLRVNLIAILAVFLVLFFTYRNFLLSFLIVLSIEAAIWLNLSIPYFQGSHIFYLSYLIVSVIQLGSTVDYAILFTSRYQDFRQLYPSKKAIQMTISVSVLSILTSGTALVMIGFFLGFITSHGILQQIGFFIGRGAIFSLGIVFFVLPGLLHCFDRWIQKSQWLISSKKGGSRL
jgi:predicted RND superfamily exporter protein